MSPAIGVSSSNSRSATSSRSTSSRSTSWSCSVSSRAASTSPASSASVLAATLSHTRAKSRMTLASISSSCWWNLRRGCRWDSGTAARYRPVTWWSHPRCPRATFAGRRHEPTRSGGVRIGGVRLEALVVDLAVRRPPDGVDCEDVLRRLVRRQLRADVGDQRIGGDGLAGGRLDHRADDLAELLVRHGHGHGVAHAGIRLEHLLDLFGEDLLAAGVDDHRAAAEQGEAAVGLDHGVVAGARVAPSLELDEGRGGLVGVLVVADGLVAADGHPADLPRPGFDAAAVVGD